MIEKFLLMQIMLFCEMHIDKLFDELTCRNYMVSCIEDGNSPDDCADFYDAEFVYYKGN